MSIGDPSEIPELAAGLAADPDSRQLRERLLEATAHEGDHASSLLRIESILWLIRNDPGSHYCRTPFVLVSPHDRVAYNRVKDAWTEQLDQKQGAPDVLRGAAQLVARESRSEGRSLLNRAAELAPHDASIEIDLGLMCESPSDRFRHFSRASELGSAHENLPVWTALAAAEASEPIAAALAQNVVDLAAAAAAAAGPAATWQETGRDLWLKAREASSSDADARALTRSITRLAYYTHWGYTILGMLAVERGDVVAAAEHLDASLPVPHDFRLDAYGPAPHLVRALCSAGEFQPPERFLRGWLAFSPHARPRAWLVAVEQRRVPAEGETG